jgi:lysylphosphatidylglycerol synthetase-like protein (DUF2156 family)
MILIFFIGIAFYMLAWKYDKNKILYTLIGIGTALLTQFVVGLVYAMIFRPTRVELENSEMQISVLAGIFSIAVVVIVYTLLKKKFQKKQNQQEEEINAFALVEDENTG